MEPSLSDRTARASIWTVGSKLVSKAIDLVTLLCLARMLGPSDFGLVAMAMTSVFITEAIFELPVGAALIRVPELTKDMFDTALTLGILRGVSIAGLLCLLAYPLALFYQEPKLTALICVLSLAPVMRGLRSPRMILYTRRLDFRPDFVMDLSAKLTSLIVAAGAAWLTGSYWAIAAGTVAGPALTVSMSYIYSPQWPHLTLKELHRFAQMIGWNMVSQVLQALNWQLEKILLPRFVDLASFGHYSVSNDITGVPFQAIVQPLFRPFLVAFSHMNTTEKLGDAYLKASSAIVVLVAPVLLLISILSDVVVDILLGPSWHNSAYLLRYLPLIAILSLPTIPIPSMAMVVNRMHFVTIKNMSDLASKAALVIVLGYAAGMQGIIVAQAIAATISLIVSMFIMRSMIDLTLLRQCKELARHLLPLALMGLFIIPAIYVRKYDLGFVRFTSLSCVMGALSIIAYLAGIFLTFKMSNATRSVEYDLLVRLFKHKFRPAV